MGLIPEEKIAEIRDRTDIVQVVSEYVTLKRSGVNWKGLCPFHGEKSPSFNVNSAKQIYHCFGCGKSGDVYRFIMEHDGKGFIDVVRELGKRAGIELPEPDRTPQQREAQKRAEGERAKLLRLNQLVCDFFRAELNSARGERGRAYIEQRGIGPAVQDQFLLGYAPAGWDALVRFLEGKKVPHEVAEAGGLVKRRDAAKLTPGAPPSKITHFDLFRDRVMFPLVSPLGEVIAFGGRTLDTDPKTPKYINSPETMLYKKGENLYGLHAAKAAIRRANRAILVEGNFDVLMMHEKGFVETVAPMGTALTAQQVHLLHRYSPQRVFLFLDGDSAGMAAAARNVGTFLDEDVLSYVASLPTGDDPDTFVAKHGKDGVELLLGKAKESVEYFLDYQWDRAGSSIAERVKLLEEEAAPLIRKVKSETARRRYAERLALQLDLPLDTIGKVLRGARESGPARPPEPQRPVPAYRPEEIVAAQAATAASDARARSPEPALPAPVAVDGEAAAVAAAPVAPVAPPAKLSPGDVELIALVADHPRLLQRLRSVGALRCIASPQLKGAFTELCTRETSFKFDANELSEKLDPHLRAQVMAAALSGRYADVAEPEKALAGIMKKFESTGVVAELKRALAEARSSGNPEEIQRLNARINDLNQQRLGLKG